MKVAELIEVLKTFDPNLEVAIGSNDEGQVYFDHKIEVELYTLNERNSYKAENYGRVYLVIAS